MGNEIQIPKEILDEYTTSTRIASSIDSDIVHLQGDLKAYLENQHNIIVKLITKIHSLESDLKEPKKEEVPKKTK